MSPSPRRRPRRRALPRAGALGGALLLVPALGGCAAPSQDAVPSTSEAGSAVVDAGPPWVDDAAREHVRTAVEEGTAATLTALDVYSPAEYRAALERHLDTVYGDDVALAGSREASQACLEANRAVTRFEAGSGARGLAGAGNARGEDNTDAAGYVNLTVTDFPDAAAAEESWRLHGDVRRACAGQEGWLGVLGERSPAWGGDGEAVVYDKRVAGPADAEVRLRTTHVRDGHRQYVLNRRLDGPGAAGTDTGNGNAGSTGGDAADLALLHRVAAALPQD